MHVIIVRTIDEKANRVLVAQPNEISQRHLNGLSVFEPITTFVSIRSLNWFIAHREGAFLGKIAVRLGGQCRTSSQARAAFNWRSTIYVLKEDCKAII